MEIIQLKRPPTLKDIAQASGVSLSTVSRSLHGGGGVGEKTIQHVTKVAQQLGYRPNIMARSLRMKKSYTIAAIVPDVANFFHADLIQGVVRTAREHGYSVNVIVTDDDENREKIALRQTEDMQVDAILAVPINIENYIDFPKPSIFVARHEPSDKRVNFIVNDDIEGGHLATNHLIQRGCKKIFYINGPVGQSPSINRQKGYMYALSSAGIPFDESCIINAGVTLKDGYDAFLDITCRSEPPYGVFCFSDYQAIGLLQAIRDMGLSIPGDVKVVGYDDISVVAYLDKPLTTVRQSDFNLGAWGTDMLIGMIQNPENYDTNIARVISPELVVRKTT